MHGLILTSPENLEVKTFPIPTNPKEDEVIVRINRISLCGSDYKLYFGKYGGPCNYPLLFGHEWSGEILEVGSKVKKINVGDYVTGDCSKWCGDCENCKEDKNLCSSIEKFGLTIDGYSLQIAKVKEKFLYKASKSLSHKAIALTECFAVARHAIRTAGEINKNSKVLVMGCGPIGMAIYMLLKLEFCIDNIAIYDLNKNKINLLNKIMNEKFMYTLDEQFFSKNTNNYVNMYNNTGYDFIFEATGNIEGLKKSIDVSNPFGHIITLGMYSGYISNFNKVTLKKLSIQGSIGGTGEFEQVIKFFEKNSSIVEQIVTSEYNYEDATEAFKVSSEDINSVKCQILL